MACCSCRRARALRSGAVVPMEECDSSRVMSHGREGACSALSGDPVLRKASLSRLPAILSCLSDLAPYQFEHKHRRQRIWWDHPRYEHFLFFHIFSALDLCSASHSRSASSISPHDQLVQRDRLAGIAEALCRSPSRGCQTVGGDGNSSSPSPSSIRASPASSRTSSLDPPSPTTLARRATSHAYYSFLSWAARSRSSLRLAFPRSSSCSIL